MGKTILIVDDDMLITTTLSTLIEMTLDYNVISTNSPAEALELDELKQQKIDMIISDFMMPEMNGLEFMKKAAAICPQAVLILLTGYADKQNAIKCINELGIYYYLEKPWDNDILIKIIQNGLEKKDLQEELQKKVIQLEVSNNEITRLYSLLESSYNHEVNKNEELNSWNKMLEQAVADRTSSLRNLLDNAGQGFLTFDEALTINNEYSLECRNIFGFDIYGKRIADLIYPDDEDQRSFLEVLLLNILQKNLDSKLDIYLTLLPQEVCINNRFIEIKYKLINNNSAGDKKFFMVILTDISDKKDLENKIEQERNTLRMVVKAIVYYTEFMDCVEDYYSFCYEKVYSILSSNQSLQDIIYEIFRHVHTFKGSFSQLDMTDISSKLHELENKLSNIKNEQSVNIKRIKSIIEDTKMPQLLDSELNILKSYLGKDFFRQKDILFVDKSKLIEIEKKIISVLPTAESKLILPDLRQLRYKPFRDLLKSYPDYVTKLSEKLEKPIKPFVLEGGNILVDIDKYNSFSKSLIHIFRNIMDHGIESIDEREALQKDYNAEIHCSIQVEGSYINLKISDDGCGIDSSIILEKAIKKGLVDESIAHSLSKHEILMLIFEDGFSTKDNITELSGRGVGLSAVSKELIKLGGKVEVTTSPNKGTSFCFTIPYEEISYLPKIPISSIMNPIIEVTKGFIEKFGGQAITSLDSIKIERPEKLDLKEYTSFINVKGALRGMFLLSMDEILLRQIEREFILDNLEPDEESLYLEDVLAECSNTILGNSIKMFPGLENLTVIYPPITIYSQNALVKYPEATIWTCDMKANEGKLSLSFVASHETSIV